MDKQFMEHQEKLKEEEDELEVELKKYRKILIYLKKINWL